MRIILNRLANVVSTQQIARRSVSSLQPGVLLVHSAESQSDGKGTKGRHWYSPAGLNLYTTLSFLLPEKSTSVLNLSQVASFAVAETLKKMGCKPEYKWVNDVLLSRKKCAGVLTEVDGDVAHVGIGLNVNMTAADIPANLVNTMTSMKIETGKHYDIEVLLSDLAEKANTIFERFFVEGFAPIAEEINQFIPTNFSWLQRLALYPNSKPTLKSEAVSDGGLARSFFQSAPEPEFYLGNVVGINPQGYLKFKTTDGEDLICHSGGLHSHQLTERMEDNSDAECRLSSPTV